MDELRESLAAYSPQREGRYTYAEYCTWDDSGGKRWELIDGEVFEMSAPSRAHQGILMELSRQFSNYLRGKPCKTYAAPFDVRLNADGADDTVVQPDLLVVCDRKKLDDKGCIGAPDLIVEILSPSTAGRDRLVKMQLYQRVGVREYWLVDPDTKSVQVYIFEEGRNAGATYSGADNVPVHTLPGLEITLADVFAY